MARSKIDFKPFAAFLYPNSKGHRNEVLFSIGIGLSLCTLGLVNYIKLSSKLLSPINYNNQAIHSYLNNRSRPLN